MRAIICQGDNRQNQSPWPGGRLCVPAPRDGPGLRGRARRGRCLPDAVQRREKLPRRRSARLVPASRRAFPRFTSGGRPRARAEARLAGFEPPDGRQLELLRESSSRQLNLLPVPWFIVPSFLVALFGSIPFLLGAKGDILIGLQHVLRTAFTFDPPIFAGPAFRSGPVKAFRQRGGPSTDTEHDSARSTRDGREGQSR